MKRKILTLLSFILLFISTIKAQPDSNLSFGGRDTIFVYDTLFIMDTVRVLRSSSNLKKLEKLSPSKTSYIEVKNANSNEKLFIFSNGQTATLSESNIKSVNNNSNSKNSEEMKKIGFLGVMLFAFQNMVLAQDNVGIYLGSGMHNIVVEDLSNTAFAPSINLGISFQKLIRKDKMFFNAKLNYSRLSAADFKFTDSLYINFANSPSENNTEAVFIPGTIETTATSAKVSAKSHIYSLPFVVGINGRFLKPFVGVEPYYRKSFPSYQSTPPGLNSSLTGTLIGYSTFNYGVSAIFGFQFPLSKKLNVNANYAIQITNGNEELLRSRPDTSTKSQRIDFTLRYRLFKE